MKGLIANNPRFDIIEETDDYIVINKPAPLKVHPGSPDGAPTLYDELRGLLAYEIQMGGQVSIVNRLDRETSGVTLVAKNAETASRFGKAMMARRFNKTYAAIVHDWPEWETLDLDAPILRKGDVADCPIYVKQVVHEGGSPCQTAFRVLRRFEKDQGQRFAVIECKPHTGRMHQLRVHLSHLGHPIVGDTMYGRARKHPVAALAKRQMLHAEKLSFVHPGTKERLEFVAPVPKDFVTLLNLFRTR